MAQVIFFLADGLRYDTAVRCMGYLEHNVETGRCARFKVIAELPTVSRPAYETLMTGTPPAIHGIVSNEVVRRSHMPNLFQLAREQGLSTAAVAYWFFSELYNRAPYDGASDCEIDDKRLTIQHGRFYRDDGYPDIDVFHKAAMLVNRFAPDFLLIHTSSADFYGERYGAQSVAYRRSAITQDQQLSLLIPGWLERGYSVLVTADHGLGDDGLHGGASAAEREVPLYLFSSELKRGGAVEAPVAQVQLAPTICRLLELPVPETMQAMPLDL